VAQELSFMTLILVVKSEPQFGFSICCILFQRTVSLIEIIAIIPSLSDFDFQVIKQSFTTNDSADMTTYNASFLNQASESQFPSFW